MRMVSALPGLPEGTGHLQCCSHFLCHCLITVRKGSDSSILIFILTIFSELGSFF